jgi:uncharacterized protein YuzE
VAQLNVKQIADLAPAFLSIPFQEIWCHYDREADTLYLNFKKPSRADDSELTDDDVIVRYEAGEVVGLTILHASLRGMGAPLKA